MAEIERLTHDEIMNRAARAVGKVDLWGPRGITMVSFEEIEAMAALLAMMGLRPIFKIERGSGVFTTTRKEA